MFRILFWIIVGAALAFWVFKNDPDLTFLLKFRDWLLSFFEEFKKSDNPDSSELRFLFNFLKI
jgi:hypothetical protein